MKPIAVFSAVCRYFNIAHNIVSPDISPADNSISIIRVFEDLKTSLIYKKGSYLLNVDVLFSIRYTFYFKYV